MTRKLKYVLVASLVGVGGVAGFAAAQGGHHDPANKAAVMQKFDANKDGKLDDTERAAMRAEHRAHRIAEFDADKDGSLSPGERAAMRDHRATERFKRLDTDGDGKLTLDEFKAGRAPGHGRHGAGLLKKP